MSEETTRELPPFEQRIIAAITDLRAEMRERFFAVEARLTTLEEQNAAGRRETRPLWQDVISRLDIMDSKFDRLAADMLSTRAETDALKKRLPPAA